MIFLLEKQRWWGGSEDHWSIVETPYFLGKAAQIGSDASGLTGPIVHLNDLGASNGDTITICFAITGDGVVVKAGTRQTADLNSNITPNPAGSLVQAPDGSSELTTTSEPQLLKLTIPIGDATAVAVRSYPYIHSGTGNAQLVAIWAYKGTFGPDWPVFPGLDAVQRQIVSSISRRDAVWGACNLHNFAHKIATGANVRGILSGDSWAEGMDRLFTELRSLADSAIGVSSIDWTPAHTDLDTIGTDFVARSQSGTWTQRRNEVASGDNGFGPDGSHVETSEVGAQMVFDPKNSERADIHAVHYLQQPNGGVFSYRVTSDGTKTTVDTDGALKYRVIEIAGSGGSSGYMLHETAGSVASVFFGVDLINTVVDTMRFHKIGNGGAKASRYVNIPTALFTAAINAFDPDFYMMILGTNDLNADVEPHVFKQEVKTHIDRVVAVRPLIDIVLIGPGPNGLNGAYEMSDYNNRLYELAVENNWGFIDLERIVGTFPDAVRRGQASSSDVAHPTAVGGTVNGRAVFNHILKPHL